VLFRFDKIRRRQSSIVKLNRKLLAERSAMIYTLLFDEIRPFRLPSGEGSVINALCAALSLKHFV